MTTEASEFSITPSCRSATSLESMTLYWYRWHISGEIQAWKEKVPFSLLPQVAALDTCVITAYIWSDSANSVELLQIYTVSSSPGMLCWVPPASSLPESWGHRTSMSLCSCQVDSESTSLPLSLLERGPMGRNVVLLNPTSNMPELN